VVQVKFFGRVSPPLSSLAASSTDLNLPTASGVVGTAVIGAAIPAAVEAAAAKRG
jgi:hypothetical protein